MTTSHAPNPAPAAAAPTTTTVASNEANADRNRLASHFEHSPSDPARWDALWKDGSFLPWDRHAPSPALVDLLAARNPLLAAPQLRPLDGPRDGQSIARPRALVPGCGRGYDVRLLAAWGYDCLGVEFSPTAVEAARVVLEAEDREGVYKADPKIDGGKAEVVTGDFFADDWWDGQGFDLIYDYTFFSALPPQTRPRWAGRLAQLLAPKGRLVCLEFPTYKEPSTGGPPWGTPSKAYVAYLSRPGEEVELGADGHVVDNQPPRSSKGLVRLSHFQPSRTHPIGQGTDMFSIWAHQ